MASSLIVPVATIDSIAPHPGADRLEIAQVLGCREGTAKSHVSRGLARLRTLLAESAAADPSVSRGGPR